MISERANTAKSTSFLDDKVTLKRLGAPLLFAYDASNFSQRLRGLHGVPDLGLTDALIIRPCNAIHTFGLKKSIDVIFLNRKGVIVKLKTVIPKRVMFSFKARVAVEMAHGTAQRLGLKVGQQFKPGDGEW